MMNVSTRKMFIRTCNNIAVCILNALVHAVIAAAFSIYLSLPGQQLARVEYEEHELYMHINVIH
jgi:hypothetical protein